MGQFTGASNQGIQGRRATFCNNTVDFALVYSLKILFKISILLPKNRRHVGHLYRLIIYSKGKQKSIYVFCTQNSISSTLFTDQTLEIYFERKVKTPKLK